MKITFNSVLAANALIAALLGALAAQVLHEAMHGVAAVAVGAQWQAFNLFAVLWAWPGAANQTGRLVIEATPALVNIAAGLLAAFLFSRSLAWQRPMLSLFLLYFAGYSAFMGFGYLFFDALFYQPGAEQRGDWRQVIDVLGGSWLVRIPLLVIGGAGLVWGFFWLARAALRFTPDASDKQQRVAIALPLLLVPYVAINLLFTVLAIWHPLGVEGLVVVALQYWFGYVGFFWAFFLAAYWLDIDAPMQPTVAPPPRISAPWAVAGGVALVVAVGVLLPTVWFV